MDLVECWCGPNAIAEGFQLALLLTLCGGIVTALLGVLLAWLTRVGWLHWSSHWTDPFLTLLRFQVCSLACWLLLVPVLGIELADALTGAGAPALAALALLPALGMAAGIRAWSKLQADISRQEPGRSLLAQA